jgi:hypothetical protein
MLACAGLGLPRLATMGEAAGTGSGEPEVAASLCIDAWRPAAELPLASLQLLRRRLPLNREPSDSAGDVSGRSSAASCTQEEHDVFEAAAAVGIRPRTCEVPVTAVDDCP